ncbi:MAG: response regulator transcription factor [Candidatus Berkelbacteria bacterium]
MRILIVEDDQKIAGAIKRGLTSEHFAVDISYDGKDGYGMTTINEYDLIILDRMLPEIDGIEICRLLRKNKKSTPIIMLTAKTEVRDRVEGLNAGADDYLTKPFAFEELLARVRALLRRPNVEIQSKIVVNDLSLDREKYEVVRAGKEVKLSAKEFALLEFLVINAGQILTKNKIIEHVWDYDADILPNTVEVFIGYLRNKIDKPFGDSNPLIETVRGFGYRIKLEKKNT